ncbi:hypothetical protein J433_10537 [Corynebacterium glutamicum MT]|uniref:O-antigen ligase family protein n=1 Tax=Corynebacterium glutamicum TaxID=1718 RepID=A0AB36I9F2_CORGT|nr:hypothetical protein [Corynebacterium glutamicum]AGN18015.1 hypothetical protein C624_02130 [Corynebacterium glutamicum SCgG1]AGN21038.1 hypothetical protein C629_02130 [Corynebacterium glutamicum SCgG2]EGV40941.1 hypothetical protein CgS9114_04957 [Corynebacterium glutamicum S9114]EOA64251.1 hypothetical protein J433_10537 [Corynebacterium glutamicum MT]EPP41757.1 hypothetical protein A583_01666 [Corynebacterium glutamicum Z188]
MFVPRGNIFKGNFQSVVGSVLGSNSGSLFAQAMLFSLVLIVGIGPRISLGFVDAEIRIQDVLIPFLVVYLMLSLKPRNKNPVRKFLGAALPGFLLASFLVVFLSAILLGEVSLLRRVAYYGRTLEMFILAVVVAGLYLRSGTSALKVFYNAVAIGAILNLAWFFYQAATGVSSTIFGQEVSSHIESYGPRLIGEPSAFGVGQYWAFVAAVAAANVKVGRHAWFNSFLILASLWGTIVAESRISMGSILVIVALLFVLGPDSERPINIRGLLGVVASISIASVLILPALGNRFSVGSISAGLQVRVESIWIPHLEKLLLSPIIGIGPGGLIGEGNQSEAHNIILRALLDFGVFVGPVFLALFLIALVRSFRIARSPSVDQETQTAAYIATFSVLATLISGLVQDSLTGVMSSHLTMISIGLIAAHWSASVSDPSDNVPPNTSQRTKQV